MRFAAEKILRGALVLALACAALTAAAFAEAPGLGAFAEDTQTYRTGQFSDVAEGAWYESAVKTVVCKGIMSGTGEGFLPDKPMTWAEAATIAARLHAAYHGGTIPETAGEYWYQRYLDYDAKNGLLPENFPGAWQAGIQDITREDLCLLLRGVLTNDDLPAINDSAIPDLKTARNSARGAVSDMYAAGVFTGKDGGNFLPAASATRAEIATAVTRLICPAQRVGADSRMDQVMDEQYGNFLANGETVRWNGRSYYLMRTYEYDSASGEAAAISEIIARADSGAVSSVYRTENGLSRLSAGDDGKLYFIETVEEGKNWSCALRRLDPATRQSETAYTASRIDFYTRYNGEIYIMEHTGTGDDTGKWSYRIGVLTGRSLRHLTPAMTFEQALYTDNSIYCFGGKLYYLCGDGTYTANGATLQSYSLYEIDLQSGTRTKLIDGAGYDNLYLSEIAYVGATAWFLGATADESVRTVKRVCLRLPRLVEEVAAVPQEANRNYVTMFANGTSVYYNASGAKRLWQISPVGGFTERAHLSTAEGECPAVTQQGVLAPASGLAVMPDKREITYAEFLGKPYLVKGRVNLTVSEEKRYVAPERSKNDWTGGLVRTFRTTDGGYGAEIQLVNATAREVKLDAIAFEFKLGNVTLRPRLAVSPLAAGSSQTYTFIVPARAFTGTTGEASLDWWYHVLD